MNKLSDYEDEALAELARLLRAGKLNVRVDEKGRIIPEPADFEEVWQDCPEASNAEKYRIAQAYAVIRAKTAYDHSRN
jgi:hypothetical protein